MCIFSNLLQTLSGQGKKNQFAEGFEGEHFTVTNLQHFRVFSCLAATFGIRDVVSMFSVPLCVTKDLKINVSLQLLLLKRLKSHFIISLVMYY